MTHVLIAVDDNDTSVAAAHTALQLFGTEADTRCSTSPTNAPVKWGDDALEYGMVYPLAVPGAGVIGACRSWSVPPTRGPHDRSCRSRPADGRRAGPRSRPHEATAVGDTGDPADAIITAAKSQHADVVVVGTHERGWFKRLFSSSVSDRRDPRRRDPSPGGALTWPAPVERIHQLRAGQRAGQGLYCCS